MFNNESPHVFHDINTLTIFLFIYILFSLSPNPQQKWHKPGLSICYYMRTSASKEMGIVKCVESKALRGKLLKKPTEAMNEGEVGKSPSYLATQVISFFAHQKSETISWSSPSVKWLLLVCRSEGVSLFTLFLSHHGNLTKSLLAKKTSF